MREQQAIIEATADADASKQATTDAAGVATETESAAEVQRAKKFVLESEATLYSPQQFSHEGDAELGEMLERLEAMECALSDRDEHVIHLEVQKAHWQEEAHRLQSALESSFAASGKPSPRLLIRMCIYQTWYP